MKSLNILKATEPEVWRNLVQVRAEQEPNQPHGASGFHTAVLSLPFAQS